MSDCAICLEINDSESIFLNCNHKFHKNCITEWLNIKPTCPLCSKLIYDKFRIYNKYFFLFKKYSILKVDKNNLYIFKINKKNKIILNPIFNTSNCFDKLEDSESNLNKELDKNNNFLNNSILNQNEYIGKNIITINFKNIKTIKMSLTAKKFTIICKKKFIHLIIKEIN